MAPLCQGQIFAPIKDFLAIHASANTFQWCCKVSPSDLLPLTYSAKYTKRYHVGDGPAICGEEGWGSCPASSGWGSKYYQHGKASLASMHLPEQRMRCVREMVWLSSFRTATMVGHGWDSATAFSNVLTQDLIALFLPFFLQAPASRQCVRDHLVLEEPFFRLQPCVCSESAVNAALHPAGLRGIICKVFLSNCV